jgi:hypothetical protein
VGNARWRDSGDPRRFLSTTVQASAWAEPEPITQYHYIYFNDIVTALSDLPADVLPKVLPPLSFRKSVALGFPITRDHGDSGALPNSEQQLNFVETFRKP